MSALAFRLYALTRRRGIGWAVAGLFVFALPSLGGDAGAHMRTNTFSTVTLATGQATWEVRVAASDLLAPLGLPETMLDPKVGPALETRRKDAQAYVGDKLHLFAGERACAARPLSFAMDSSVSPSTVTLTYAFSCRQDTGSYRVRYDLFFDLDALATGFVTVRLQDKSLVSDIFRQDSRELAIVMQPSAWRSAVRFWSLGIEHIFTGYDHLAFLAGLLFLAAVGKRCTQESPMIGAPPRQALVNTAKIVTAFTVSHSMTLVAAVYYPGLVPASVVEPLIALSVAAVGAENLVPRLPGRRWMLAFGFGLIHGFGFASVLAEIGLPKGAAVAALFAFNVGVECGQLCVVLSVLPLLLWVARKAPLLYHRVFVLAGGVALVAVGVFWFWQRMPS